jgi:threonine/homoserine/homoserine lactone efflux protein
VGYVGVAVTNFKDDKTLLASYAIGTFAVIILTDFLKAYLAGRIRSRITPKRMSIINKISGVFIFLFGVSLILRVLYFS